MNIIRVQGPEEISLGIHYEYDADSAPLGEGGMGKVFSARCIREEDGAYTPVAIKFIKHNDDYILRKAITEASVQIAGPDGPIHPNVIRMWGFIRNMEYDSYSGQNLLRNYIAMELLVGVGLDAMLHGKLVNKAGESVPLAQELYDFYQSETEKGAIRIMKEVLTGVSELHKAHFVHRDIDPSNVMITNDGHIKVIDFGIAKNLNRQDKSYYVHTDETMSGARMGKMAYAAPELITGKIELHNPSSDVYSLGIMMYQLLVGEVPFMGSEVEVMQAQLHTPVPVNRIANQDLRRIVKKATMKEQSLRYQDALEMLDDLYKVGVEPEAKPFPILGYWLAALLSTVLGTIVGLLYVS